MRIIGLIDMDCFYAQVEQRERPELWDKPVVVVQHAREGAPGGILAVSYEARSSGVKRGMMIPEAMQKCPELNVCFVPQGEHADKADIQKYRDASAEVFAVLHSVDNRIVVERASVDEAFLDLSQYVDDLIRDSSSGCDELLNKLIDDMSIMLPSSHLANGNDVNSNKSSEFAYDRESILREWLDVHCRNNKDQLRLALATEIIEKIRADIKRVTQFYCSAGVGPNKMLAKLVCARHKPRQQSVVPLDCVSAVFNHTPIRDVRMMGGKLGTAIQEAFSISTMGQLAELDYDLLARTFPTQSRWIWQIARGQDDEPVKPRSSQSSIAVSKNFPGRNSLVTTEEVKRWVDGLSKELAKRLVTDQIANNRTAENVVVSMFGTGSCTKTVKIYSYNPSVLSNIFWTVMKSFNKAKTGNMWDPPVLNISLSANRFSEGVLGESKTIMDWVKNCPSFRPPAASVEDEISEVPKDAGGLSSRKEEERAGPSGYDGTAISTALDDDGWQVFDPTSLDDDVDPLLVDMAGPSGETDEDVVEILEMGDVQVAKDVYEELPEFIKAELSHHKRISESRQAKDSAVKNEPKAGPSKPKGNKRPSKASKTEPPPKKGIDSFFVKK